MPHFKSSLPARQSWLPWHRLLYVAALATRRLVIAISALARRSILGMPIAVACDASGACAWRAVYIAAQQRFISTPRVFALYGNTNCDM